MDQKQEQPMGAPPPYTAQPGPGEVQKAYNPNPAQSTHPGYQTQPANVYQAQPPQAAYGQHSGQYVYPQQTGMKIMKSITN